MCVWWWWSFFTPAAGRCASLVLLAHTPCLDTPARLPPSAAQVPNGELTAPQLRYLGDVIAGYGADGCADITTRANMQLRGVLLEDADGIIAGLQERGLSSLRVRRMRRMWGGGGHGQRVSTQSRRSER